MKRTFSTTVEEASKKSKSRSSTPAPSKRRRLVKKTTLQSIDRGIPFPRSKTVNLIYENQLSYVNSATAFYNYSVLLNSAYDFDKGTVLGNKQPLYYDSVLSASGPYKFFKVKSWKTTWTFINHGAKPITVWISPPVSGTGELDSAAEYDNFPGVKRIYLTEAGGSKTLGMCTVTGNIADVYKAGQQDFSFYGGYGNDPAYTIYGGFGVQSSDGTATPLFSVAVRHEMNTELDVVDALVS